jgi:hypothetical protein
MTKEYWFLPSSFVLALFSREHRVQQRKVEALVLRFILTFHLFLTPGLARRTISSRQWPDVLTRLEPA